MPASLVFLDTNLLVYAFSADDISKQELSRKIILSNDCTVSTQNLSEFCNVSIKKLHTPIIEVEDSIARILNCCNLFIVNINTICRGLKIHERYQFSYYDSVIVASAEECGCAYLFTEDLQDGQILDGLEVRNIFKT